MTMLAITIQQPWAWAVIHAGKHTENRVSFNHWKRAVGHRLAIHAGQRWSDLGACHPAIISHPDYADAAIIRGAIIGTVLVKAIHEAVTDCCKPWAIYGPQVVHLVLTDPQPVDPIRHGGRLGLWGVPGDIAELLQAVG